MEVDLVDHLDRVNSVVSLMLQGNNPTQIATETGLARRDVIRYIEEWQKMARNNSHIQERAKDAITGADQHYSMIIHKMWGIVEEAETQGELRIRRDTLTSIATVEEKRINMLQKAGLLDNKELLQQLEDQQHQQEMLIKMMQELAEENPELRSKILSKVNKYSSEGVGVALE